MQSMRLISIIFCYKARALGTAHLSGTAHIPQGKAQLCSGKGTQPEQLQHRENLR